MPTNFEQKYMDRYLDAMYPNPVAEPTADRVFPEETSSIQSIPRNTSQEIMGKIGTAIQTGADYLDFAVIGLPDVGTLSLKDLTVGDIGKVMEAMSYGFSPTTGKGQTLRPTPEALDLLNAIPAFQLAGKAVKAVGKAAATGVKKAATELAPNAAAMAEKQLRKTGMIMDIVPPRVDSIDRFPLGPTSIKPKVIAPDVSLHREMNADNLTSLLRDDKQFTYSPAFVTDNPDLAIGQGTNKGVKVTFRANSVSGEEHKKPMTGSISGREYKADVFAPQAIESITFATEADLKKVRSIAANTLRKEFERMTDDKKDIVFIRKPQATQENK
jgi:hypothetical protein